MTTRTLDARHKIQLGGLVIKSGLRDLLNLEGDLQLDSSQVNQTNELLGGLLFLNELLRGPEGERWRERFRAAAEQCSA